MRKTVTRVLIGMAVAAFVMTQASNVSLRGAGGACGMQKNDAAVAFCETFDHPFIPTSRSGQLDGTLWGVSRITGNISGGTGLLDEWSPSTIDGCGGRVSAQPDASDVIVCNGQLRESSDDKEDVTVLAIYPKQPFDFANRTGTVAFDVTNDNTGSHGFWPEFWLTDQPVPAPFLHGDPTVPGGPPCDFCSVPRNGLGISFAGTFGPQEGGQAPNCPNDNNRRWIVDHIIVVRDYAIEKISMLGVAGWETLGCAIQATGPNDGLNHVEIRISQAQIEVWASDPGSSQLRIMSRTQPTTPLSFTRGLIWIEDSHYNATKCGNPVPCPTNHTFTWDNVAFDGPAPYRDRSFDVLDGVTRNFDGTINLGWNSSPGAPAVLATLPMTATEIATATAAGRGALLMFNFTIAPVTTFNYVINGHLETAPSPAFPQGQNVSTSWHSVALPVPFGDLVPGPQAIAISGNKAITIANVSLVLIAAAPVPGGSTPASPTNLRLVRPPSGN